MQLVHLNSQQISNLVSIKPPFLFIDEIKIDKSNRSATAKRFLINDEWFFLCHLPNEMAMPGSLLVEAMLQTMVALIYTCIEHGVNRSFITHLNMHIQMQAKPGDLLELQAILTSNRMGITKGEVNVFVGGKKISSGNYQYASPHLLPNIKPFTN